MAPKQKGGATDWLQALTSTGLTVTSARDGSAVTGWLDTGNYALNWAVSGRLRRGYPLGHTVELFGDPSTGKSFLAARALASAQAAGGVALVDDVEGAYTPDWLALVGIDAEALAYRRSQTVQDHLATTEAFLEAFRTLQAPCGILVCDSLAQLTTVHEQEVKLDRPDMTKAKELRAFFRLVGHALNALPVVHVSTNHVIANIGNMFQKRTTSGGGGPKYQASVRLDLRGISKIKDGKENLGVQCRVYVDKNRIVAPWKEVKLAIPFFQPISAGSGLIELLVRWGLVEKQGHFLFYEGERIGRAYADVPKNALKLDDVAEHLLDQVPELPDRVDAWLGERGSVPSAVAEASVEDGEDTESLDEE